MIEAKLSSLGIVLPPAPPPLASYVPVKIHGGVAQVSGQLPMVEGELMATGLVPSEVEEEQARACARQCAINALAALRHRLGTLDGVLGVWKLSCFVASEPGFGGQPAIANGASDLLHEVMGDAGRHARAAVGVSSLPLNAPVEVEFSFIIDAGSL